jgi:hypothetical protein
MSKPTLDDVGRRCLNALHRGATAEFTCSGLTGFSVRWPIGMVEFLYGSNGLWQFNDAAVRGSRDMRCMPRQSAFIEFCQQNSMEYYRSVVRLLPEAVELAAEIAREIEAAKLMPSEIGAMRLLAAGGIAEYQGEGRFCSGSWWSSIDDQKISVTSKAMRTLCQRGYVERADPAKIRVENYRCYVLSATGAARLKDSERKAKRSKTPVA